MSGGTERYYKAIASGKSRWSEIKRALEVAEGIEIDDSNFSDLLKKLIKAGFIEKRGEVCTASDPIALRAIEKHL